MRYLVTGGCGFIGSHLVDKLLENGHEVVVLDNLSTGYEHNLNKHAELIVGDIRSDDDPTKSMKNIDGCFHLAAIASVEQSRLNWTYAHSVNLSGTINIFESSAKTSKFPVVYASSAAVFGDIKELPLTENSPTRPSNAYGADKLGCEIHGRMAWEIHGVSNIGLRFFNVYGPRQDPASPYSGVISIFSRKIANREKIHIHGDGSQTRDFIYVEDIVDGIYKSMSHMANGEFSGCDIFNLCTGKSTSILSLANTLMDTSGTKVDIVFSNPREGDIKHSLGNPQKAKQLIGFKPECPLDKGLDKTFHSIV